MIIEVKIVSQRLIRLGRKNNTETTISLLNRELVLDRVVISEEHRLSEDLLPIIDGILEKNKLVPENIDKMILKSDMEDNFTTQRIAKSVVNAFNWAIAKIS